MNSGRSGNTFSSPEEHRAWLESQATLPEGFRVGTTRLEFVPEEAPERTSKMALTVIAADSPTPQFGALFTRNAFPGAPVLVGRQRLREATLGAVVINNKVSNVLAPGGVEAAEQICAATGNALGFSPSQVLPCSTGIIGWKLPVAQMKQALPQAVLSLQSRSVLPAAESIMTTDLYPKIRRVTAGDGVIVGIAKGAGMIEPNLATMLVFLLTDVSLDRDVLRRSLADACDGSFGAMSIDGDTSTSDTVALLSSGKRKCPPEAWQKALNQVCAELSEDIVRNGEGIHHVIRVRVQGASSVELARGVGKAIVNSPLVQCAVCGNDPNVGRLMAAIGKYLGARETAVDASRCRIELGGEVIFQEGAFRLDGEKEKRLVEHLKAAELYASVPPADGLTFAPPIRYPPHERRVELNVDLGMGSHSLVVLGGDRSHEYISENADYRS